MLFTSKIRDREIARKVLSFIHFTHGFRSLHGSELTYFWKLCQARRQQLILQSGVRNWPAGVSRREIEVLNPQAWDSRLRRESWQVQNKSVTCCVTESLDCKTPENDCFAVYSVTVTNCSMKRNASQFDFIKSVWTIFSLVVDIRTKNNLCIESQFLSSLTLLTNPLLRSNWPLVSIEWTLGRNNLRSNWLDTVLTISSWTRYCRYTCSNCW